MQKSYFLKDKRIHMHYKQPELFSGNKKIYCDPVSLTITGVVLAAAAGGTMMYGQYQEGQAKDKYYKALADQNEAEARAAQETADLQSTIGQNEAAQKSKELKGTTATVKGTQKAAMASMGLYGVTAEDILTDTTNRSKLDEANIRYNADINSWASKKEANDRAWSLRNQAGLFKFAGQQAKTASYINMTTTFLGTASSIALMGAMGTSAAKGGSAKPGAKPLLGGPKK